MSLLTSQAGEPNLLPTRRNLYGLKEASAAKNDDILVVYLAGHGVTAGGEDGDFYYLCSDAISDDLRDHEVRDKVALSSATLGELVSKIPAI